MTTGCSESREVKNEAAGGGLLPKGMKVRSMLFPRLEPWFVREVAQREGRCGGAKLGLVELARAREAMKLGLDEWRESCEELRSGHQDEQHR